MSGDSIRRTLFGSAARADNENSAAAPRSAIREKRQARDRGGIFVPGMREGARRPSPGRAAALQIRATRAIALARRVASRRDGKDTSGQMHAADSMPPPEHSVLFVCMGNICRSPTAEGVFRAAIAQSDLRTRVHADSAGTGDWHVGSPPDRRAIDAARRRGYDLAALRARQVQVADFARFGWILAMDRVNLRELETLRPGGYAGHLGLFLDLAPGLGVREVPDPYYGGPDGFERVLDLVEAASAALIERLRC